MRTEKRHRLDRLELRDLGSTGNSGGAERGSS
jgi:hypothetical protein